MKLTSRDQEKSKTQLLVKQFLKNRDEHAFHKLYRRCTPRIYMLALRILGGKNLDAEEAVQETWLRAIQGLPQFRWQSTFETWLYSITIRSCQEILRKHKKQSLVSDTEITPSLSTQGKIDTTDLERAISQLPDGYRQVLVLFDIEGYTHKEIAELLNIEPGTSKSQLFNARRKVRHFLQLE